MLWLLKTIDLLLQRYYVSTGFVVMPSATGVLKGVKCYAFSEILMKYNLHIPYAQSWYWHKPPLDFNPFSKVGFCTIIILPHLFIHAVSFQADWKYAEVNWSSHNKIAAFNHLREELSIPRIIKLKDYFEFETYQHSSIRVIVWQNQDKIPAKYKELKKKRKKKSVPKIHILITIITILGNLNVSNW